jgi:tRNA dimethylallyltransferase
MQSIGDRVATMFNNGLGDEACMLRKTLPQDHWALGVMGYKEALLYHDGIISRAEAESKTALRHRHYAKRQFTWFNKESFYRWIIS